MHQGAPLHLLQTLRPFPLWFLHPHSTETIGLRLPMTCQIHGCFSLTLCMNVSQLMSESNLNVNWLGGSRALSWRGWGSSMKILGEGSLYPLWAHICCFCLPLLGHAAPALPPTRYMPHPCHHPQTANNHLLFPSVTHKEITFASFNFSAFFFFIVE